MFVPFLLVVWVVAAFNSSLHRRWHELDKGKVCFGRAEAPFDLPVNSKACDSLLQEIRRFANYEQLQMFTVDEKRDNFGESSKPQRPGLDMAKIKGPPFALWMPNVPCQIDVAPLDFDEVGATQSFRWSDVDEGLRELLSRCPKRLKGESWGAMLELGMIPRGRGKLSGRLKRLKGLWAAEIYARALDPEQEKKEPEQSVYAGLRQIRKMIPKGQQAQGSG